MEITIRQVVRKHRERSTIVKDVLHKIGLTVAQAAFDLRINPTQFSSYVQGWKVPDAYKRKQIADYLGVDEDTLWPAKGVNTPSGMGC